MTDKVINKDNSKERVAYDLMLLIAAKEVQNSQQQSQAIFEQQQNREYWLRLYGQCHRMTNSAIQDYREIL